MLIIANVEARVFCCVKFFLKVISLMLIYAYNRVCLVLV